MFTPLISALIYLSVSFLLGLALGFAIWKLGAVQQIKSAMVESDFWRQRLDEARMERDLEQDKIEALEHAASVLKSQLSSRAS